MNSLNPRHYFLENASHPEGKTFYIMREVVQKGQLSLTGESINAWV